MRWPLTFLVGAITAAAGGALAGFVASMAVDWYSVPSREGAAGFFVLGFVILGLVGGLLIGVLTSRIVAGRPQPGFLKALGLSQMTLVSVVILIGGAARLMADVGPTIDGKTLLLNVEFRWPNGAELPADTSNGWFLRLSSVSGRVVRVSCVDGLARVLAQQLEHLLAQRAARCDSAPQPQQPVEGLEQSLPQPHAPDWAALAGTPTRRSCCETGRGCRSGIRPSSPGSGPPAPAGPH